MTSVRMNVAMSGSTPSTPTFAKIAVKAANTADKSAQPCQPIAAISSSSLCCLRQAAVRRRCRRKVEATPGIEPGCTDLQSTWVTRIIKDLAANRVS